MKLGPQGLWVWGCWVYGASGNLWPGLVNMWGMGLRASGAGAGGYTGTWAATASLTDLHAMHGGLVISTFLRLASLGPGPTALCSCIGMLQACLPARTRSPHARRRSSPSQSGKVRLPAVASDDQAHLPNTCCNCHETHFLCYC